MLERYTPILKIVCAALAIVVIIQVTRLGARSNPFEGMTFAAGASGAGTNQAVTETNLPAAVQARVDRITQSEILGAVVRPLPMALLGIGGQDAILRTPAGQTVLLREGEESGGVKLLRIGTNRILIEHENQKKELTLFSGFGGATLLEK
jgi:ABC-type proline/glycine betaine transport system permease subunit